MKPWEYGTRHVFKISTGAFAALQMPDTFFTHNFIITAAFILACVAAPAVLSVCDAGYIYF